MNVHPLRTYRIKHALTQKQLAEILGVSYATVNHIELGRRRVRPEKAREWEKIIEVTRAELCPEAYAGLDGG